MSSFFHHISKKIMVEVKAFRPPHVLKLWLLISKGMLPVKYFTPTKPLFVSVKFHGDHETATMMRQNLAALSFGDISGFKIVVSVCLYVCVQEF